jgi:predicted unusual protein kinase regulating ubiquinone biosynthesis (AarF/ABC1/UbiB family)
VTLLRHPGRVWQVISALVVFFVGPRLHLGGLVDVPAPVRLRLALERLGGAWVKLGQMLSMRLDLLPAAYCDELFKLLDQVEPFPYEQVRSIVEQELGDAPEVIFESFETASFAAASIGQVHRAVLHGGEPVAVKVQRPGIRKALNADIELMYAVARILDWTHVGGVTRSRQVIDEFARWTSDELDYLVEARQAQLMLEHARGERFEHIARVHRSMTTSRVLTTELLDGIPLVDIIVAVREGDEEYLASLAADGHDLDRIILHLDWNMLNQVYVFGYFHADLHPANLFVLPDDVIGYVDFGIVGRLTDRARSSLIRYSRLLFGGDVEGAIEELLRWLTPGEMTDLEAATRQLVRDHEAFLYETAGIQRSGPSTDQGPPLDRLGNPYLRLAVGITKTVRVHDLRLSNSLLAYLRMLVTLGTLRHQLAVHYEVAPTVQRFFRRLARQQTMSWMDPRLNVQRFQAGGERVHRAIEFMEFLESQEPAIRTASTSLMGIRGRMVAGRRWLIRLGIAAIAVAAALYVTLADPVGTRSFLPGWLPYDWVHLGLLVVLVVLVAALARHLLRLARSD